MSDKERLNVGPEAYDAQALAEQGKSIRSDYAKIVNALPRKTTKKTSI